MHINWMKKKNSNIRLIGLDTMNNFLIISMVSGIVV